MFDERPWPQRRLLRWLFGNPQIIVKYERGDHRNIYDMAKAICPDNGRLKYAKPGDAGLDLYYAGDKDLIIKPGESLEVPAGLSLKIPDGYVGLLRCRSSTFTKRGLFVVHNTIDSGYVGCMFTTVWYPGLNNKQDPEIIKPWERLSQIIIVPYLFAEILPRLELPETARGISGFGSSGR